MNARRLASLAATVADIGEEIIFSPATRDRFSAESYWQACEQRFQCWNRVLTLFKQDLAEESGHRPWPAMKSLLEEILFSEMLTRIWTAVLSLSERDTDERETDSILRAVWIGHLAARQQALTLIMKGLDANAPGFKELDETRRKLERWTDLLLSRFAHRGDVRLYSFDDQRVSDWAEEKSEENPLRDRARWEILSASLRKSISKPQNAFAANPDLNRQIAVVISSSIPEHIEQMEVQESGSWLRRMTDTAHEMETLIHEYISASA